MLENTAAVQEVGAVDMMLDLSASDLPKLQKQLEAYGLRLTEENKPLPVLVLHDHPLVALPVQVPHVTSTSSTTMAKSLLLSKGDCTLSPPTLCSNVPSSGYRVKRAFDR